MTLKDYLKKLHGNTEFNNFMKENPSAYFCSGFFTIDKEGNDNKQHLDFFVPEKQELISFQVEDNCKKTKLDTIDKRTPEKISTDLNLDFNDIEDKIKTKMHSQAINSRMQKIILALQKVEGRDIVSGTVFLSMFGLLKISIDAKTKELLDFDKRSILDMVNIFKKNN